MTIIPVLIVAVFMVLAWTVRAVDLGVIEAFRQYGIVLLAATMMTASAVREFTVSRRTPPRG